MNTKNMLAAAIVGLLLTSCGIYNKYESKGTAPADAFGTDVALGGENSLADISWREFFADPMLQDLIDTALVRNTDLKSARLAIEKSEASLKAARLGYLPSFSFAPQGGVGSFNGSPASWTYSLPLQMSWDIEIFGNITTQKRKAEALMMQARYREESVRANLISTVARQYMMLQVLDRQLEILTMTDSLWNASLETQKALWENGKSYSTAVNQMESSYINVKTQIVDVRRNIKNVENTLCGLLAIPSRNIPRSPWGSCVLPDNIAYGVPAGMLQRRPDIRIADFVMAEAFYNTQEARQAFYPKLSLSGLVGWTNNAGGVIFNPGALLLNAAASLMQPIFSRGKLIANKKIATLNEEDMKQKYVQTVINAGNQVNEALADYQTALEKHEFYQRQVEVLQEAYTGTHALMESGKASYLEVLTAQETYLNAQLNEAMNMYKGAHAVIALYIALGGTTK